MMDFGVLIGAVVSVLTGLLGFFSGRKKANAEATKAAFEAYAFAISSLRTEFENRFNAMQKRIDELEVQRCSKASTCKLKQL